ncbi:MAG: hypothetical protein WCB14_06945 [Candidatus Acidiferrales bacterium]
MSPEFWHPHFGVALGIERKRNKRGGPECVAKRTAEDTQKKIKLAPNLLKNS